MKAFPGLFTAGVAAVAGALALTATASPTGENLTTAAYSHWRAWGSFTNQTGDYVKLGDSGAAPITQAGVGASTRVNNIGHVDSVQFSSNTNQATLLSDSSTTTLTAHDTSTHYAIASAGDGVATTFAGVDTTSRTYKVVVWWQSDNGSGKSVNVVAHLSDSSAADVTATLTSVNFGNIYQEYTFTANAASAGQTLTITVKSIAGSGTGNVGVHVAMVV